VENALEEKKDEHAKEDTVHRRRIRQQGEGAEDGAHLAVVRAVPFHLSSGRQAL